MIKNKYKKWIDGTAAGNPVDNAYHSVYKYYISITFVVLFSA